MSGGSGVVSAFRRFCGVVSGRLSCAVVAVAGSHGKTTTKEMIAAMLAGRGRRVVKTAGNDNGVIGLPRTLCARAFRRGAA
ncbi:MAG: Mur ligase family protein [Polyangiaceae bacterium]